MKKAFSVLNAVLLTATVISAFYYYLHGGLWLKALTSSGFVLVGIANLIYTFASNAKSKVFAVLMTLALTFSFIGDVVLNVEFLTGAVIFAAGHVFYFAAHCIIRRFALKDIAPIAAIFVCAALVLLLYPKFNFGGEIMKYVCIFYALVISCMVGKAISNLTCQKNLFGIITVVGCALFFASDIALVFYVFGNAPKIVDTVCLVTYFPAQCTLALSVFVNACKNE